MTARTVTTEAISNGTVYRPPAQRTLRVVIADDHPFYRASLSRLLSSTGFEVVAAVPNGNDAVQAALETVPDAVVIDLNMPGLSGLRATKQLTEELPAVPVLVLSVSAEEADVTDAILAGAAGYLLKDRPVEEIADAIRAAVAGQLPMSPPIGALLLRRLRETEDPDDDDRSNEPGGSKRDCRGE
jgi:DNA-binding NarL/FixJ family response regulator